MQWRKYRLSAGAIAVLMAFRLAAQSFTPALIQGRRLDGAAAAQIEASLKADPHNLEARARLLGYYSARGAQDPDARGARLQAIQWLIENEPSALLLRYPVVRLQASDFAAPHAAFLETLRRAWREQVARRPDDPVVIENAVRSVGWVESTINSGEKLVPFLERLRVLEPGDPEWAIGLADVYSAALSRGVAQNASGAAKQFAIDVRAELEKSGDAALVGLSGGMLEGGSPLFRNLPADSPLRTFGETLLRRAARLNPQNPGWTQFLSASAPHNMASLGGTLQESDLWPGGHEMAVPPGAIRMPAETEKARRPALTLIVPPPAAGAPCNLQFDALIGRDGRIEKLQLIAFDHLAYSNLVFLSSALDALREARYPPALAGGQAVEAVTRIELTSPTNIPPPVSGVVGGVPGGLAGGTPGGVLGSMPPLPPPPLLKPGDSSEPHRNLVSVAGKVIEARLIQRVPPEYPDLAKRARVSGVVHLKAIINAEGKVENLELISGPALLAPAAIAAVKQWVYQPTLINGQPVAIQTEVDVNFTLNQ